MRLYLLGGFRLEREWRMSDFVQAKKLHNEALELYRTLNQPSEIAFSLNNIAVQYRYLGQAEQEKPGYDEALALARRSGDPWLLILLLNSIAVFEYESGGDPEAAESYWKEALDLARRIGSPIRAVAAANLGELNGERGDYTQALAFVEEALALTENTRNLTILGYSQCEKAVILTMMQETDAARRWFQCSLRTYQEGGDRFHFATTSAHLAKLEAQVGNPAQAAQLVAWAVKEVREKLAARFQPSDWRWLGPLEAMLKESLGDKTYSQAWNRGRAMTREEISAALQQRA